MCDNLGVNFLLLRRGYVRRSGDKIPASARDYRERRAEAGFERNFRISTRRMEDMIRNREKTSAENMTKMKENTK